MQTERLLRVPDAAEMLALKTSTLRRWILLERIGVVHLGPRAVRIPRSEIERLILQGTIPARAVR